MKELIWLSGEGFFALNPLLLLRSRSNSLLQI